MRFLITAGNTRERIDQVRDWGNIFTGNTGRLIARAFADVGEVDLLSSNRQHLDELQHDPALRHPINGEIFSTHEDLREKLSARMKQNHYDAVVMAAAVSDYRPVGSFEILTSEVRDDGTQVWIVRDVQAGKVSGSYERIAIAGERTEKIVDLFRTVWDYRGLLIKFKLEVGRSRAELLEIGRRSRLASGADYLIANTLDMVSGNSAGAYLISDDGEEWIKRDELADRLVRLVQVRH